MSTYAATGTVLRQYRLGEADRIVVILASDGRQIRAVAKGTRRPKSKLAGCLQPYNDVTMLLATGRSLDIVTEARVLTARDALAADLDRCTAAAAVTELAEVLSDEGDDEPRVAALTAATLDALLTAPSDRALALLAAYFAKALSMHGWRPGTDACVSCGGTIADHVRLSATEGGVLCGGCAGVDPVAPSVDAATAELIGGLIAARLDDVVAAEIEPADARKGLLALRGWTSHHVGGKRLKALDMALTGL